jgi:hypothetical protein
LERFGRRAQLAELAVYLTKYVQLLFRDYGIVEAGTASGEKKSTRPLRRASRNCTSAYPLAVLIARNSAFAGAGRRVRGRAVCFWFSQ